LFSGESLPLDLLLEWSHCVPNAVIDNCYGNTENGGMCFLYRFVRDGNNKSYNGILSIGKPTADKEILIVDDTDSPVPSNVHGELSSASKQLTPGYLNNPDKNKEAFFIHNNTRFYRTGDICYQDEDGDVLYCGRLDSQVKISGCRIELGEIEYHTRAFLSGINAICMALENNGNTEIGLFVESPDCDSKALIGYLQSKLPSYMIPKTIVNYAEFPLTVNGKIDRMALKNRI
jgi:acyl-coenzyme A synthetase/AMP-(fatty) acid ligase